MCFGAWEGASGCAALRRAAPPHSPSALLASGLVTYVQHVMRNAVSSAYDTEIRGCNCDLTRSITPATLEPDFHEEEKRMRYSLRFLSVMAVGFALFGCPNAPTVGTIDDPLLLETYYFGTLSITWNGYVGSERLYIKIASTGLFNTAHTVTLTAITADVDLYTFSDAFVTEEQSSTNAERADESCVGTTTASGDLYLMIDGTASEGWKTFTLGCIE